MSRIITSPALRAVASWILGALLCAGCESLIGLDDHVYDAGLPKTAGKGGKAGTGGTAGNSTVDAGETPSLCKAFCARAVTTCQGEYAVYHKASECEPACNLFSADEVRCRDEELTKAESSFEFWDHCQGATMGGSRACGGNCENYCALMDKVCTDKNRDKAEVMGCVAKCKGLSDREQLLKGRPANESRFNVDRDHEGDTLQCRLVHVTIASQPGFADAHCWHAAIAPRPFESAENPCATGKNETMPHCEDYCHIVMSACTNERKVYESEAQCLAVCKVLDLGKASDYSDADTVGCRKTHAYNALVIGPDPHCAHSGPGGANICGKDCPAYCRFAKTGCEAEYKTKFGVGAAADTACNSGCNTLRDAEPPYNVAQAASTPLACRMLAVTRVLEQPDRAPMLCDAVLGGGVCAK